MAMQRDATDDIFRELQKLKSDTEALQREASRLQAKAKELEQKHRESTHGIMDIHVIPNVTLRDSLKSQEIIDPQAETTRRPFKISHLETPLKLLVRLHNDGVRCESSSDHTFLDMKVGDYNFWIVDNAEDRFMMVRNGEETWISTEPPKFASYGNEMRLQFGFENLEVSLDSNGDLNRYVEKKYENELMTAWVKAIQDIGRVRKRRRVE